MSGEGVSLLPAENMRPMPEPVGVEDPGGRSPGGDGRTLDDWNRSLMLFPEECGILGETEELFWSERSLSLPFDVSPCGPGLDGKKVSMTEEIEPRRWLE